MATTWEGVSMFPSPRNGREQVERGGRRHTVLAGQAAAHCGDVCVDALTLLLCEGGQVVPVLLERVGNLVGDLGSAQLEDGVVVEGPILGLLVLAPDLLALDAKDLHADAARGRQVIGE